MTHPDFLRRCGGGSDITHATTSARYGIVDVVSKRPPSKTRVVGYFFAGKIDVDAAHKALERRLDALITNVHAHPNA